MIKLTDEQKRAIYKRLEEKSLLEVGYEFGLNKEYKNKNSLRTFILGVRREVEQDPEKFVISPEIVMRVREKMQTRALTKPDPNLPSDTPNLNELKLVDLAQSISKKAAYHLDKALSKKSLSYPITQIALVMGIGIDKWLLLSGKATENIAFKAKIDVNLSAEKLLEQLLKFREEQKI
jgi:hypothetical protein